MYEYTLQLDRKTVTRPIRIEQERSVLTRGYAERERERERETKKTKKSKQLCGVLQHKWVPATYYNEFSVGKMTFNSNFLHCKEDTVKRIICNS